MDILLHEASHELDIIDLRLSRQLCHVLHQRLIAVAGRQHQHGAVVPRLLDAHLHLIATFCAYQSSLHVALRQADLCDLRPVLSDLAILGLVLQHADRERHVLEGDGEVQLAHGVAGHLDGLF